MQQVAILIKDFSMQYEGLRTSLGLLLEDIQVRMVVLDHAIEKMDDAYAENLAFLAEMGGHYYSNNSVNVKRYGFRYIDRCDLPTLLHDCDIVIPF